MTSRWLALLVLLLTLPHPLVADEGRDYDQALAQSRQAVGRELPDLSFRRSDGAEVSLADYRGQPLLLSLVYTGCTDVCPAIIEHLYAGVEESQTLFGAQSFSVVTVGFDTAEDTPQRMRSFARQHGVDLPNWDFLSADKATIQDLTQAVGFSLQPSAGGFDHMAQVSVVDAEGRVYQQIYGGVFEVPAVVEPLKDLVYGRTRSVSTLSDVVDRIKLFCTIYNPNTGRYYFNYSLFVGLIIGGACLLLVFAWLVAEFRRNRRAAG
ncbi:MAG: SCO family protein [Rhodovibrionaceae bacterium]|nr:SCO family protein [Rhodovibrionaceae bacterium]